MYELKVIHLRIQNIYLNRCNDEETFSNQGYSPLYHNEKILTGI